MSLHTYKTGFEKDFDRILHSCRRENTSLKRKVILPKVFIDRLAYPWILKTFRKWTEK